MMNQLIAMNTEVTMNSREIAELIGVRHSNLFRSIERLVKSGVIDAPPTEFIDEINNLGFTVKRGLFVFSGANGKRDSIIVIAQNCPEFTARLVDRWQELEAAQKPQIPQTYAAALLEAGRLAMELEQAEAQLAIAAPKAAIVDRVIERTNLLNATQVGQQVGLSAVTMNRHLDNLGCVYSKGVKRGRVFKQEWIDGGFGETKQTEQGYPQALFTTSGAMRVVEMLTSEGII